MLEIRLNGAGVSFCRQPTNKPFFHSNLRNFSNCRESFWKFLQNTMASGNRFPTSLAKCCKIFYPFPAEQSQSFRSALQTPAPKKTNGEIPPKFYRNYIREGEEEDCKSARKRWKKWKRMDKTTTFVCCCQLNTQNMKRRGPRKK